MAPTVEPRRQVSMRARNWKSILVLVVFFFSFFAISTQATGPSITSLSVTSGPVGTSVTITGKNFGSPQGTSTVKFNGTTGTPTSWGSTSIIVPVPSAATTGNVVVTVSGVASNGINFTVIPHITSLSISSGAVGASVTITGTTFGSPQGTSTVKFNGTTASVTAWTSSSITVTVPGGATTGNVVVTVSSQASNGVSFTVVPAPSITSLSVTSGAVGAAVTINGSNFGTSQGSGSVTFNGTAATVGTWSATSITTTVPSGATTGNVVVNASGVASNGSSFTVVPAPSITSLSVTTGAVGAAVTINGSNFGTSQGTSTVKFNGTTATVTTWGASSIAVTVPSGATTGNVVVHASGVDSNGSGFTVVLAPSISSLTITTGAVGAAVTITGSNFGSSQGSGTATFNGTTATVTTWSASSIAVTVPSGATTGNVVVHASGVDSNGLSFTVVPAPSITTLSPTTGAVGASVTIAGSGYGATQGTSTVTFNGTAATAASWSASTIEVLVPPGATTGNVVVNASGVASNGPSFTVVPAPAISTLSATSGVVGASVTITGSNFGATQGSGTVSFNGTYTTPTSWSATSIVVPVPIGATTGNVVVSASGVASNGINFTVVEGLGITGVSPTSGVVGSQATVTGTGFGATQGSSTISLNGTSATVASWSHTSIVAFVPSGASSGPFSVTVSGQTVNSATFTVTALPSGWSDSDVGSVGAAGSASFANGTFTVSGAGIGIDTNGNPYSDAMNFAYQSLSGDGTIVARVVSLQGTSAQAGVTIRETLDTASANAFAGYTPSVVDFWRRLTTSGNAGYQSGGPVTLPYWVKVVRSGSAFSGYLSADAVNWTQVSSAVTISMATNVYIGLAVSSDVNATLATATFDNVSTTSTATPGPVITSVSATTGSVGSQVTITGSGFGAAQGGSVVLLNGAPVTINFWSSTSIVTTIPTGATSGYLAVTVAPSMDASNAVYFAVTSQPLPSSWLNQDIGVVGLAGSATYANSVFTVNGAGQGISYGTFSDGIQFVYQPLSGDGTIVARVVSLQGASAQAGVTIRETLNSGATNAYTYFWKTYSTMYLNYRASTGGNTASQNGSNATLPYWLKLARSGSSFSAYSSYDGANWTQIGTTQTITMTTNVYIGLAVSSQNTSALATATFDNVSVSSTATPVPVITNISATTGSIGSQVVINGSGFGASQGGSLVLLNDAPMTINSWEDASIIVTIPSGATSGYLAVSVAPGMNTSNAVYFTVTSQPLPRAWFDQDIGPVGVTGSATYANGTFTVSGAGVGVGNNSDGMHFVYQPLSGDGTIVARVVSLQGSTTAQAGVMIRETFDPAATNAFVAYKPSAVNFTYRPSTSAGTFNGGGVSSLTLPCWVKLVRSGSTFTGYASLDGVNWAQAGSYSQSITMAQNVYIGLAVSSQSTTTLATATLDNISISSAAAPAPVITKVSATTGSVGTQVVIAGTGFGSPQSNSLVTLNNVPVTIASWTGTSIVIMIPTGATSGYLVVSVAPSMNDSNAVYFTVTSQPLPTPWLDQDVGQVGLAGSASFTNGTFTVSGAGGAQGIDDANLNPFADGMHFVYQPLSGDGAIIARVVSAQGGSYPQAGVMIRETLDTASANAFAGYTPSVVDFWRRLTTGGNAGYQSGGNGTVTLPYWVRAIRSGSSFYGYYSADGVNWTQMGTTQTITMATNVYIGLAVSGNTYPSVLATATFDNVSVTIGSTPFVTGLSPSLGGVGTSVTITGSNFGATQGSSTVSFNGALATSITSWSNTQIVAIVPNNATTGNVTVTVNSVISPSNAVFTVIRPVINSITPPGAQIGATVTLSGSGFGVSPAYFPVSFNGVVAQGYNGGSDTTITVQVPGGATSGPVTVTEDGVTSNGVQFTVLEALSVTGIAPNVAPVGTSITITGTGFGPTQSNSTASFYGGAGTVSSWSDTQIVATVPATASSGQMTVSVGGIVAYGPWFTLSTTVNLTDSLSNPTTYVSQVIGGKWVSTTSQGSGCSSCTVRGTIQNTYDSRGNLLSKTNELGATTTYTYDSNNNVTSVSVPIAPATYATTRYTYNGFGEVLTTTDPMGNVTTNAYDANGNLLTVTSPPPNGSTGPSVTQFAYNSLGELTRITDPRNNVTTLAYYPTGLINTITDAQQNVTTYVYDTHGNRTSVTDAMQNQTTFAYDTGDRLKTITYPGSTGTTTFTYDNRGRRTSVTDQNGKTTTYAYDDADRLTSVTDAATPGNVTTYGYDTENNLTSIQDANNHTTTFAYDAFGRAIRTTFPSSLSEYYYYDAVGNLITKTDRKNQTITYTYDQLNRLTGKTYPDNTAVNNTYDNDSRLIQVSDPTGTYQFTFDNMGRLTQATTQYTFLTGRNFTASYSYDAASNRTGFTDPENGSTSYVYDTLNRLQTLTPPAAFSGTGNFGFSYDALSRRTQMTRPNGLKSVYAYDNLSRLLSVLHQSGATTLDGASYTVDNAGNRATKTDQLAGVASNYTYDPIYELTQVTQGVNTTESYTYDPVGNRLSSLGVSPYDYNGNTQTKVVGSNTTSYTWDFENRMSSVTLPGTGGTVSFKYDPFGRRIYKSSSSGTSIYAYSGPNVIEEVDQSGSVVARYAQDSGIDQVLAELRSGTTSYYHQDGLNSVTSLSNAAGALAQTYTFDSFGNQTASSGSLTNSFRYTGREFDPETSLYYYRARYYDPNSGRFISEDPKRFQADVNFYPYVSNSPTGHLDTFGWSKCKSGACADCPGGRWVSGALTAEGYGSVGWGVASIGGIAFSGVFI